ncbi:MAG TPA: hypothetical protein VHY08_24525 [Bacillota bacterium]|nr:hypothetical protein [Bacillota bacterium]
MLAGELFITPHAVRQFQTRIAPWMTYEQALGAIIRELHGVKEFRPTVNGKAQYVRTRGAWEFRAVIGEGEGRPSVVTILRSGKGRRRGRSVGSRGMDELTP